MFKKRLIIVSVNSWNIADAKKFSDRYSSLKLKIISKKSELSFNKIKVFKPDYIFVLHWPWRIEAKIYNNFKCILFHMTDLPYGRGGSPLQNLIVRGIYRTKISAIKVVDTLDAGDVYLKINQTLNGSAERIFRDISRKVFENMIPAIMLRNIHPVPQKGKVVIFKRRMPEQSNISSIRTIRKAYDHIRMMDAEGYPKAFMENDELKYEFSQARLKGNKIVAKVCIAQKQKTDEKDPGNSRSS